MAYVEIEELLTSGAHFGHLTRRWNPYMRPYIFMERNGIHIIDLKKTQVLLDEARDAAERIAAEGKRILFVGTKKQARDVIKDEAARVGMNFVAERWLGGMLTNFATIRKSIKRLQTIEKMESDGTWEQITKKERLMVSREKERLVRVMGGIVDMNRLPGALFIVDIKKEHLAVKEAKTLGIPVIAIVDTNTDPRDVAYPIPANDDSLKTVALITKIVSDGIQIGREAARSTMEDMEGAGGEGPGGKDDRDPSKVGTRRRTRARRSPAEEGQLADAAADAPLGNVGSEGGAEPVSPQTEGMGGASEGSDSGSGSGDA
jgi:small subunit ribosomal protein S2